MNDSSIGTDGSAPVAKRNQLATISEHKLKANRENSKKSTGPRTLRGKAYSRRNALKHGLFARQFMDFISQLEDPEEWEELLNGLWVQYRPIGKAEELEVERAALCWWRLKRVWRYENVTNRVALRDIGRRELREQAEYCKTLEKEEEAVILQLQDAMKQIEAAGEISQELKQRMFATMPGFESISWYALIGPAGMPQALVSKIQGDSAKVLHSADIRDKLAAQGVEPGGDTPDQLRSGHGDSRGPLSSRVGAHERALGHGNRGCPTCHSESRGSRQNSSL